MGLINVKKKVILKAQRVAFKVIYYDERELKKIYMCVFS